MNFFFFLVYISLSVTFTFTISFVSILCLFSLLFYLKFEVYAKGSTGASIPDIVSKSLGNEQSRTNPDEITGDNWFELKLSFGMKDSTLQITQLGNVTMKFIISFFLFFFLFFFFKKIEVNLFFFFFFLAAGSYSVNVGPMLFSVMGSNDLCIVVGVSTGMNNKLHPNCTVKSSRVVVLFVNMK